MLKKFFEANKEPESILNVETFKEITNSTLHVRDSNLGSVDAKLRELGEIQKQLKSVSESKTPTFFSASDLEQQKNIKLQEVHEVATKAREVMAGKGAHYIAKGDVRRILQALDKVLLRSSEALEKAGVDLKDKRDSFEP